jgi:hypothetical protein
MVDVAPAIREAWQNKPEEPVELIIHVSGDMAQLAAALEQRGVTIKRRFRLTNSLAIRCNGKVALQLLKEPRILRIETDRLIKALRR